MPEGKLRQWRPRIGLAPKSLQSHPHLDPGNAPTGHRVLDAARLSGAHQGPDAGAAGGGEMGMTRRTPLEGVLALAVLSGASATPALAHPHVWIVYETTVLY